MTVKNSNVRYSKWWALCCVGQVVVYSCVYIIYALEALSTPTLTTSYRCVAQVRSANLVESFRSLV